MTERDPYREHQASPRGRNSMRPVIDSAMKLLTEGRRATPIGIAVSIALPIVIVIGLLAWILGKDGLVQITSAWGESAEANKELAAQMSVLSSEVRALRLAVTAGQTSQEAARSNLSALCDLTAELNGGKPHDTWCSDDGRAVKFSGPPLGLTTPLHVTAVAWQRANP